MLTRSTTRACHQTVFQVEFGLPDWFNGFEHDTEEAARARVALLRELAGNRGSLAATHLSFPSVCPVAPGWRSTATRFGPGPCEYRALIGGDSLPSAPDADGS